MDVWTALARTPEGRELHHWISHDEGAAQHLSGCIAQTRLSLRLGAQVMLLGNLLRPWALRHAARTL